MLRERFVLRGAVGCVVHAGGVPICGAGATWSMKKWVSKQMARAPSSVMMLLCKRIPPPPLFLILRALRARCMAKLEREEVVFFFKFEQKSEIATSGLEII